jgi:hypothetical protein
MLIITKVDFYLAYLWKPKDNFGTKIGPNFEVKMRLKGGLSAEPFRKTPG